MTINVSVHIGNMLGSQLLKVKEANLLQTDGNAFTL